jgi:hypothetical protein
MLFVLTLRVLSLQQPCNIANTGLPGANQASAPVCASATESSVSNEEVSFSLIHPSQQLMLLPLQSTAIKLD